MSEGPTATETFGWDVFAYGLHRQRLQDDVADGVRAMVELYYQNYTDADHLESDVLDALELLMHECETGVDVEEIIRTKEKTLNVEGSDGTRHKVRTFKEESDA